jgi:hypothetical protein
MPQLADFGGFYNLASNLLAFWTVMVSDMPTVAPTIARSSNTRQWIRCQVIAKSAGSGEPDFT